MGRRRHKSYIRSKVAPFNPHDPPSAALTPLGSVPARAKASTSVGFMHNIHSYLDQRDSSSRLHTEKKAQRLRVWLQRVVSANAALVCAEAIMGYFVVLEDQELEMMVKRDCLKAGVCFLSLIQIVLVVCYWKAYVNYLESVQMAISPDSVLQKGLLQSPTKVCCCAAEAAIYLFTLYPGLLFQVHLPGSKDQQSSDSLAYVSILLRSYQAGRLLYWLCPFSNMRTHIFTRVTTVQHSNGFLMRCCVARYGFRFLAFVCGFMVLILGIIAFAFERHHLTSELDVVWNDLWLAAFTLTTIGYGNINPYTFAGQLCMVICCLFGTLILGFLTTVSSNSLNLSLKECDLYSHLLYTREKERFRGAAALTLQQWWRLMKMRLFKKMHAPTVIRFYSQLREYRTTLVVCQRVKDRLFERQIAAFDKFTHTQFHKLNEYLQPIHESYPLLQDLYRNEYRIKSLCRDIYKLTRKHKINSSGSHPDRLPALPHFESETQSISSISTHKLHFGKKAKAKLNAYQNVVGRLIKEEVWTGPSREVGKGPVEDIPQLRLSQPL